MYSTFILCVYSLVSSKRRKSLGKGFIKLWNDNMDQGVKSSSKTLDLREYRTCGSEYYSFFTGITASYLSSSGYFICAAHSD
jgi:hypothetical protein